MAHADRDRVLNKSIELVSLYSRAIDVIKKHEASKGNTDFEQSSMLQGLESDLAEGKRLAVMVANNQPK